MSETASGSRSDCSTAGGACRCHAVRVDSADATGAAQCGAQPSTHADAGGSSGPRLEAGITAQSWRMPEVYVTHVT